MRGPIKLLKKWVGLLFLIFTLMVSSRAFSFGGGYAQIPYLIRLITENVKRYQQLRQVISQAKNRDNYMKLINHGIDNAVGVILSLPIEDAQIFEHLKTFEETIKALEELYGVIPKGENSSLQKLHDSTIAESIKMINKAKEYAKEQEKNSAIVFRQASSASPKGAQRMAAVTSAQILHSLSQLIKINGQMLKLQSEGLAVENMGGKNQTRHFNKINTDLTKGIRHFKGSSKLPKF